MFGQELSKTIELTAEVDDKHKSPFLVYQNQYISTCTSKLPSEYSLGTHPATTVEKCAKRCLETLNCKEFAFAAEAKCDLFEDNKGDCQYANM